MSDRPGPWNNFIGEKGLRNMPVNLELWTADPEGTLVVGQKNLPLSGRKSCTFFCGTDVSGVLHIGHLYNFLCGCVLAFQWEEQLIVSLNEGESILSRGKTLGEALTARAAIWETLEKFEISPHSRLDDPELNCIAFIIFRILSQSHYRDIILQYYGKSLDGPDLLSVSIMAALPLRLSIMKKTDHIIAVYGTDELPHLCLMHDLYLDPEFESLAKCFDLKKLPSFGFACTNLLPGIEGPFKMSKTIPSQLVPFEFGSRVKINRHILDIFQSLISFVELNQLLPITNPVLQQANKLILEQGKETCD